MQNFYLQMEAIFGDDMTSSVHVDNKGKYMLILGEWLTQGLDDITLTAEAKYAMSFTQSGKKFVLSLHYNGRNIFLLVKSTKKYINSNQKTQK